MPLSINCALRETISASNPQASAAATAEESATRQAMLPKGSLVNVHV